MLSWSTGPGPHSLRTSLSLSILPFTRSQRQLESCETRSSLFPHISLSCASPRVPTSSVLHLPVGGSIMVCFGMWVQNKLLDRWRKQDTSTACAPVHSVTFLRTCAALIISARKQEVRATLAARPSLATSFPLQHYSPISLALVYRKTQCCNCE